MRVRCVLPERYHIGCTGWGYDDWRGGFYPPGTPASEYLTRYARVFNLTEVDSTYYRAPTRVDAARWASRTPSGFTFTIKMPGAITHENALRGVEQPLEAFVRAIEPFRKTGKLGPLLVQLPATFTRERDQDALHAFLGMIPRDYRVAVELRHESWWHPDAMRVLSAHGAALVWSVNQYARTPPEVTSDFLYARFIGDRKLTRFDRVQRDKRDEFLQWRKRFENEGASASDAYLLVNNHYMGFAPATAALAADAFGLPEPDLSAAARGTGQSALGEF